MTYENFNKIVEETLSRTKSVLFKKQSEYNLNSDVLGSFKRASAAAGRTSEQVLHGYMLKHWMSVTDMINSGEKFEKKVWDEKVGDLLNYLLLLRGLLEDENRYSDNDTSINDTKVSPKKSSSSTKSH